MAGFHVDIDRFDAGERLAVEIMLQYSTRITDCLTSTLVLHNEVIL